MYHELPPCDTLQAPVGMFDENSFVFQKKHYGLIAQDLQRIYPDLVYENDNGYLSVNYTELIPLLIQSIKELKDEVDLLSAALVGTRSTTANGVIAETGRAVLYQNAPNPFTERTEIKFEMPENSKNAFIYIFNMQGELVKQISISSMQGSILLNGSELTAGMYLYSLIVDGKEIDTKKMNITIKHCNSQIATYLHLLDASGVNIAYNGGYSGSGACPNSSHAYLKQYLAPGTYYIVSEGYSANGVILTTVEGALPQSIFEYNYDTSGNRINRTFVP